MDRGHELITVMEQGGARGRALFVNTFLNLMEAENYDRLRDLCNTIVPRMPAADQSRIGTFIEEIDNALDPQWEKDLP
jgi:hypothetical protein